MKFIVYALLLFPLLAIAETCTVTGPAGYNGAPSASLVVTCGVAQPPPVVTPTPPPPVPSSGCASSQLSTPFGSVRLKRQCSGQIAFGGNFRAPYSGALDDITKPFTDAKHPGPWPKLFSGYSAVLIISTDSYVSLRVDVPSGIGSGQMQFTNDPSFGVAGIISLSTTPGDFSRLDGNCGMASGASNSLFFGFGASCPVTAGKSYYVNFAPVLLDGTPSCFNDSSGTCSSTRMSYSELAGG